MANQSRLPQTALLGGKAQKATEPAQVKREAVLAPTHLLFQIGNRPGTVTTIGRQIKEKLTLGRADAATKHQPDIDLSPFNAVEKGVSREHAMIVKINKSLYIRDPKSRNRTQVNDVTLDTEQSYPLHDGDVLLLGGLQVVVWFVNAR